jgi:hypothetical protein
VAKTAVTPFSRAAAVSGVTAQGRDRAALRHDRQRPRVATTLDGSGLHARQQRAGLAGRHQRGEGQAREEVARAWGAAGVRCAAYRTPVEAAKQPGISWSTAKWKGGLFFVGGRGAPRMGGEAAGAGWWWCLPTPDSAGSQPLQPVGYLRPFGQ